MREQDAIDPPPAGPRQVAARVAQLEGEAAALRAELAGVRRTRDTLGTMLRGLFGSRTWGSTGPVRAVWRMVGRADCGIDRLVALTEARRDAGGAWSGSGPGSFLVPAFPVQGWVRVRATIEADGRTECSLYFDGGSGFRAAGRIPLGAVSGRTVVDRLVAVSPTAYAVRFDPVEGPGVFRVEAFAFEPVGGITAAVLAKMTTARKVVGGDGRP